MKKRFALFSCLALLCSFTAAAKADETIPDWEETSPAMASIVSFVEEVSDEASPEYVPASERIAVFDLDGTLFGERFPTYFDQCMMLHRILHDENYEEADPEDKAYCEALEAALLAGEPEPDSSKSSGQIIAEAFEGCTVEEYQAYVRDFMSYPAVGFEGLTYGEGFFKPMVSLVGYLSGHDFQVYIVSGAERHLLRELIRGTLDEWIPPYQIIGTTFSLAATNQGDKAPRDYTLSPEDDVLMEGNMVFKNVKMNKVVSILNEIGIAPVLAFGNSSGDFAMGEYAVRNGGKAYMLLCDDLERDYGDLETAESFAAKCEALGFETVSMRDEFATIYGDNAVKTEEEALEPAA